MTGDAAAFMALKQAYDVLIHADRRAAYDRSAQQEARAGTRSRCRSRSPRPFPEMPAAASRHPRLRDLPTAVLGWHGAGVDGRRCRSRHASTSSPPRVTREPILATAPDVPPAPPGEPAPAPYGPAPVRLAGTPNFYIVPTASQAMLWRMDDTRGTRCACWRQLPAFSAVQGLRLLNPSGMVEVKVTDNANGYVE